MPLNTDAVTKGCVDSNKACKLNDKCNVCTKEIEDLVKLDSILPGASLPGAPKKQRGRPKLIVKTDIKIVQGPITVAFD